MAGVQVSPVNMEKRVEIDIRPGDTVRVWQKVEEAGGKTRLQPFEGVVLAKKHGSEPGATFTVRRMNDPYGVEKIFPLFSPNIDRIEIIKRAKVRRAKLYHIRKKAAREVKRQMRNMILVDITTEEERVSEEATEANAVEENTEGGSDATSAQEKVKAKANDEPKAEADTDTDEKTEADSSENTFEEEVEEKEKKE